MVSRVWHHRIMCSHVSKVWPQLKNVLRGKLLGTGSSMPPCYTIHISLRIHYMLLFSFAELPNCIFFTLLSEPFKLSTL